MGKRERELQELVQGAPSASGTGMLPARVPPGKGGGKSFSPRAWGLLQPVSLRQPSSSAFLFANAIRGGALVISFIQLVAVLAMLATMAPEPLATPREVAAFFQVPLKSLYRWRYQGKGPPGIRVGKHLRYSWSAVQRWCEEQGRR